LRAKASGDQRVFDGLQSMKKRIFHNYLADQRLRAKQLESKAAAASSSSSSSSSAVSIAVPPITIKVELPDMSITSTAHHSASAAPSPASDTTTTTTTTTTITAATTTTITTASDNITAATTLGASAPSHEEQQQQDRGAMVDVWSLWSSPPGFDRMNKVFRGIGELFFFFFRVVRWRKVYFIMVPLEVEHQQKTTTTQFGGSL
jgi:hypothetical protein